MRAVYVEPKRTPLTFAQALHAMKWALKSRVDHLTDEVVALALAKTALETGRWTQIWQANWGNIKAGSEYSGMFTCITLNEVLNGKIVWFAPEGQLSAAPSNGGKLVGAPLPVPDGHPQTRMRAYANEYDGADSYVDFVAGGRYKAAWAKLLVGDALGYVRALKVAGYFTADEALYARGVVALHKEMLARIRSEEPTPFVDLEWERLIRAVPGMQFDLAELVETSAGSDFAEVVA